MKILSENSNKIDIKQIQKTIHITPINLEKLAEKYAMCEWDPESKSPMRIMFNSNLDKYGVVWFQSPTCFQIKVFSHNEQMVEMIKDNVIMMIRRTMTPTMWDKLIMKLGREWEIWEETIGTR